YIADANNNAFKERPRAFVPTGALIEEEAAGSDHLLPVLPTTESLTGIFAPSSDQPWLTLGSVANAVINFSFTGNTTSAARVAHITVLGQQITVTQAAPSVPILTGYTTGLATEVLTYVLSATDPGNDDLATGFTYSVNWGDGSGVQTIAATPGNGS